MSYVVLIFQHWLNPSLRACPKKRKLEKSNMPLFNAKFHRCWQLFVSIIYKIYLNNTKHFLSILNFLSKILIFLKNPMFSRISKFFPKINNFVKIQNLCQNSKSLSKINTFVKIQFFVKVLNFCKKSIRLWKL